MRTEQHPITRVNLKLLQAFVLVAENNSFKVAADLTRRSQSAVSAQIRQLENQLGTPLFRRTTREVKLTSAGGDLLASTQRALHELGQGFRRIYEAADLRRGTISLACSSTVAATFLPATLARFGEEYPGVRITLRELQSSEFGECLRRGHADFCVGPSFADSGLAFETLLDDPLFALVPRRLAAHERADIRLDKLAQMPLLLFAAATAIRNIIEAEFKKKGLHLVAQYQCTQAQTLVALAEASLGAAILPESVLRNHAPRNTRIMRIVEPEIVRKIAISRLRGQSLTPTAARLVELLRSELAPPRRTSASKRTSRGTVF